MEQKLYVVEKETNKMYELIEIIKPDNAEAIFIINRIGKRVEYDVVTFMDKFRGINTVTHDILNRIIAAHDVLEINKIINYDVSVKDNNMVNIPIVANSDECIPEYKTSGSAGCDVIANIDKTITLRSLERKAIPTGICIEIPQYHEVEVKPRSGISLKEGKVAIIGTIDSDYRGEIKVILCNMSNEDIIINPKERIGQLVLREVKIMNFKKVDSLSETDRGTKGFGHTGK